MLLMLSAIAFNYSILRNLKDVVVITAKSSGAEVIPFIKVWVLLPMAVLATIAFTRLSSRFSQEKVCYIIISAFLLFYLIFAFLLYPARDILHPHAMADWLQTILPEGFMGLIAMFRNWTFTAFYVMCELWGTMVLSVLFWGFANEVTKIGEARRFYSVIGIGSNIAAIIAGQTANFVSFAEFDPTLPFGTDAWEQTIGLITMVITTSGLVVMSALWWMNRNVLNDPSYEGFHSTIDGVSEDQLKMSVKKKKRKKLSLRESFSYLIHSEYICLIAALVVSYNLVINLVEVVWKSELKELYPHPNDYSTYMNNLTSISGIFSTLAALFMAKVIEKIGWTKTALVTPMIMLVTSFGFFTFFFLKGYLGDSFLAFMGMTPLAIAVFFGSTQNALSKASKYSFFDTTKEMAFIPLNHEEKLRGKAAIDGVGSRLGKSGGSVLHQGLLMLFVTFSATAPYVAAFLFVVIGCWVWAARTLGKHFARLVATEDPEALKEIADDNTVQAIPDSKAAPAAN